MEGDRIEVKDYWGTRELVVGFSQSNEGMIAVGTKEEGGAIAFVHVKIEDLETVLEGARKHWGKNGPDRCKSCDDPMLWNEQMEMWECNCGDDE